MTNYSLVLRSCFILILFMQSCQVYSMELVVSQTDSLEIQLIKQQNATPKKANRQGSTSHLVEVKGLQLPSSTMVKAITSGLPNHLSLQFALHADDTVVQRRSIDYQVTFDLWDEVFRVKISNGTNQRLVVFEEIKLLFKELSSARLTMDIPGNVQAISAQMVVNPIEVARIKRIHRWIAQSKGHEVDEDEPLQVRDNANLQRLAPPSSVTRASNTDGLKLHTVVTPRFEKLFDRLLKEYADPNDIPALWKSTVYVMSLYPRSTTYAKSFN
jgi:hypothetical protein